MNNQSYREAIGNLWSMIKYVIVFILEKDPFKFYTLFTLPVLTILSVQNIRMTRQLSRQTTRAIELI